jgi:hypothetical protein
MEKEKIPWWLWPNLLSLDAPVVALAWAWLFAKAWGVVSVPWQLWLTLGSAVWIIYAADRIIDARRAAASDLRHQFHARYAKLFVAVMIGLAVWSLHSILFVLSKTVLQYGLVIMVFAVGYFVVACTQPRDGRPMIGKNALAGLTFAYGAAAGIHAYSPVMGIGEMFFSVEVLIFAGLCVVNMTAIDFLNLEGEEEEDAAAVLNLATLLVAGVAMFIYMSSLKREVFFFHEGFYHEQYFYKPFAAGILVGAACLFLLNQGRRRLDRKGYRVLVDLAVLAPVFVFWVMVSLSNSPMG